MINWYIFLGAIWLVVIVPFYWSVQLGSMLMEVDRLRKLGGLGEPQIRREALAELKSDRGLKAIVAILWPLVPVVLAFRQLFVHLPKKLPEKLLDRYMGKTKPEPDDGGSDNDDGAP